MRSALFAIAVACVFGCSNAPVVKWPDIHPAKGIVKAGGKAVSGRSLQLRSEDAALSDFHLTADVGADGTFSLVTGNAQDKRSERRPGAPTGKFKVTYFAPQGDQTAGRPTLPIELPQPVTIKAGDNDISIELPKETLCPRNDASRVLRFERCRPMATADNQV